MRAILRPAPRRSRLHGSWHTSDDANLPRKNRSSLAHADCQARANKNEALAFRLLNRFLDISDSMGDPDASLQMDNSDFEGAACFCDSNAAYDFALQALMCHLTSLCPA
jgi:hypothetical protein